MFCLATNGRLCLLRLWDVRGTYFWRADTVCCCPLLKGAPVLHCQGARGAPFLCYRAETHLPACSSHLPSSPATRYDYFSSAPPHHIFQVRSYPSPLSFFMACFCPCAALHICTVPVQYVKEVNICSVQNVISIYLFSLLVIYWCFRCLRKKRPASAMYLNKHDCCVCTHLQGFLVTGETKLYI